MAEIVSRSMPATVESLRLAEEASTLVAAAPQLMAAEEESQRAEIALGITGQIQMLDGRIQRLRDLDASENDEIEMVARRLWASGWWRSVKPSPSASNSPRNGEL